MPKGVKTGNPTNIVCWLVGGHYHDTVWGISYDESNLLSEIKMFHYQNPVAEQQGVKILGITMTGPDDVMVWETYTLVYSQEKPPAFAVYVCEQSDDWETWRDYGDEMVNHFKKLKGYDLQTEHLDPTKMPGQPRTIEIK